MTIHRIQASASTDPITEALAVLPEAICRRLESVRFVVGIDPLFAGLHSYETPPAFAKKGRTYRNLPHFCWPEHLAPHSPPTVVLPETYAPRVVTHELGHALDYLTDRQLPTPEPVSSYARNNRAEAVAEAFAAWLHPNDYPWAAAILAHDPILSIFEELAL